MSNNIFNDEGESLREYTCDACYLCFDGYWSSEKGRESCPACGCETAHAGDTFGCFYWIQSLSKEFGEDFMVKNFWWVRNRVHPIRAEILDENKIPESPSLDKKPEVK